MRHNGSRKLEAFDITAYQLPATQCVTTKQSELNSISQSKNFIVRSQVVPKTNETVL